MINQPEFSRPVAVDSIGIMAVEKRVEATVEECAALARRLGIPEVLALAGRFTLRRIGTERGIFSEALLEARIVQTCVVSLEEFQTNLFETFTVRFVPEGAEAEDLELDGPDEIPFASNHIDLGEATTEQLALVLDPFPRKPGVTFQDATEPGTSPFSALQALRRH